MKAGKIFISLIILAVSGALVMILSATSGSSSEVLSPSEVIRRLDSEIPRLRVVGRVAPGEFKYSVEPVRLEFQVVDRPGESPHKDQSKQSFKTSSVDSDSETSTGVQLTVIYDNLKPDMFAAGRDILVDGELRDGVVYASSLMTQCPSKYEPEDPAEKYGAAEKEGY